MSKGARKGDPLPSWTCCFCLHEGKKFTCVSYVYLYLRILEKL